MGLRCALLDVWVVGAIEWREATFALNSALEFLADFLGGHGLLFISATGEPEEVREGEHGQYSFHPLMLKAERFIARRGH